MLARGLLPHHAEVRWMVFKLCFQGDERSLEVGTVQEECISIQPECLPLYTFSVFRNINTEEEEKASDVFWFIGCFFFLNGSRAF